jgi:hypothetical protein
MCPIATALGGENAPRNIEALFKRHSAQRRLVSRLLAALESGSVAPVALKRHQARHEGGRSVAVQGAVSLPFDWFPGRRRKGREGVLPGLVISQRPVLTSWTELFNVVRVAGYLTAR